MVRGRGLSSVAHHRPTEIFHQGNTMVQSLSSLPYYDKSKTHVSVSVKPRLERTRAAATVQWVRLLHPREGLAIKSTDGPSRGPGCPCTNVSDSSSMGTRPSLASKHFQPLQHPHTHVIKNKNQSTKKSVNQE